MNNLTASFEGVYKARMDLDTAFDNLWSRVVTSGLLPKTGYVPCTEAIDSMADAMAAFETAYYRSEAAYENMGEAVYAAIAGPKESWIQITPSV